MMRSTGATTAQVIRSRAQCTQVVLGRQGSIGKGPRVTGLCVGRLETGRLWGL